MPTSKLVAAHRGYHASFHENTIEAMQAAIDVRVDMVEFDVRRCADDEFIVHHDKGVGGKLLANIEYVEALRSSVQQGYRIPRLSEVLALAPRGIAFDIELKEAGYEESVLRVILDFLRPDQFLITSFETAVLSAVRAIDPAVRIGLLKDEVSGAEALAACTKAKVDFLAPECAMLTSAFFQEAKTHGITLLPWTVDDPALVRMCFQEDCVFGIITDRPVEALKIRAAWVA